MEKTDQNTLFRRFVGLVMDAAVWDATTFSKDRDRLLDDDVAQRMLATVATQNRVAVLMSDEHISVYAMLNRAWASYKTFRPEAHDAGALPPAGPDGGTQSGDDAPRCNGEKDWHGQKDTHRSLSDLDARLARKTNGQTAFSPMPHKC